MGEGSIPSLKSTHSKVKSMGVGSIPSLKPTHSKIKSMGEGSIPSLKQPTVRLNPWVWIQFPV